MARCLDAGWVLMLVGGSEPDEGNSRDDIGRSRRADYQGIELRVLQSEEKWGSRFQSVRSMAREVHRDRFIFRCPIYCSWMSVKIHVTPPTLVLRWRG